MLYMHLEIQYQLMIRMLRDGAILLLAKCKQANRKRLLCALNRHLNKNVRAGKFGKTI
jgi:transcriptional regulator of acetoin/glycerol metabolism